MYLLRGLKAGSMNSLGYRKFLFNSGCNRRKTVPVVTHDILGAILGPNMMDEKYNRRFPKFRATVKDYYREA